MAPQPDVLENYHYQQHVPMEEITLDMLPDTDESPGYPIWLMMAATIRGAPDGALTAEEIRTRIAKKFPALRSQKPWRATVRHDLSSRDMFQRVPRPLLAPGRGDWWKIVEGVPASKVRKSTGAERGKRARAASSTAEPSNHVPKQAPLSRPRSKSPSNTARAAKKTASMKGSGGKKKRRPRVPSPTPSTCSSTSAPDGSNSEAGVDAALSSRDKQTAEEAGPPASSARDWPFLVNDAGKSSRLVAQDPVNLSRPRARRPRPPYDDGGDELTSKRQRVAHDGWCATKPIASTSSTPSMLGTPLPRDILDIPWPWSPASASSRRKYGYNSPHGDASEWAEGLPQNIREVDDRYRSPAVRLWNIRDGGFGGEFEDSPRPTRRNELSLFPDPFERGYAVSSERDIRPLPRRAVQHAEERETGLDEGYNLLGLHHVANAWDGY